jgi:hypothetical protein
MKPCGFSESEAWPVVIWKDGKGVDEDKFLDLNADLDTLELLDFCGTVDDDVGEARTKVSQRLRNCDHYEVLLTWLQHTWPRPPPLHSFAACRSSAQLCRLQLVGTG